MDPSDVKIVGAGSGGTVAAALSWVHLLGEFVQVLASVVALVASCITVYLFIKSQRGKK
jgi:hypothetical protein